MEGREGHPNVQAATRHSRGPLGLKRLGGLSGDVEIAGGYMALVRARLQMSK